MKILHVADTHLGYSAYRKINENGINQREEDTYDAFKQFVDYAIDSKPDLIIHAGDLFDSVRPTNRAITFAIQQILRLSRHAIPIVIIAGNHEHPKLKETGHILSIFNHIEHVYPIYNAKYETISFKDKIVVHAVPQCSTKEEFSKNLNKIKIDSSADYNILTTHGSVKSIKEFSMNEFDELAIPISFLKSDFDYIALGHYHKYTKILDNAFYSGSLECFTFADAGEQKGFVEIDLNGKNKHNFIPIKNRPMIDVRPIKCSDLSIHEIMKKIKETIKEIEPKDKIFRITLEDIPQHIYRSIDFSSIREVSRGAVHYEIKAKVLKDGELESHETTKIDSLMSEFTSFLKKQEIQEKDVLLKMGIDYIKKIETKEEEK
ncbi:MAG: exonuclease SbcCD subunit D [Candidatus Asgardarchaeum californiense]|nr:MAG: exonuclease SbcCD subunit D [Candidatus Asgardarchaeum californiense]